MCQSCWQKIKIKIADYNGLSGSNHDSKLQLYMIVVHDTLQLIRLWINKIAKNKMQKFIFVEPSYNL